ncbi:hypothetical protein FGSG_14014 [Fusarium graminearum PH-1]|uniref:Chromosome 2, complete genome n=1 Tax=Gibberella zeae (strain ATCC MYA-4620 / CBS 123657 / FGSC 9075 / NRRL 31084 / PH-1) TaxID=229533 RepID=I1SAY3_GIBZE|nr:hypothetical protein FGSG_14014 [Fusarium graminearum PH-1]ESU08312.1 hypothetical protein FGSG_14014 [Fusarium graminearum PH-1]CEF79793.1 unnamed protein product [Fusarium graminearum]|eukprot:XP_011323084.1 hypothetical protein FGSG_14014 [Fusarium graminearum PH-1]
MALMNGEVTQRRPETETGDQTIKSNSTAKDYGCRGRLDISRRRVQNLYGTASVSESEQIYVTHASERTKSVGQSGSPIEQASQHASIGPVLDHEKYRKSKLVMLISTSSI